MIGGVHHIGICAGHRSSQRRRRRLL